jgi:hypothetical protein
MGESLSFMLEHPAPFILWLHHQQEWLLKSLLLVGFKAVEEAWELCVDFFFL